MKRLKLVTSIFVLSLFFVACSSDDDTPEPVNEEEVITTMTVTLTPDGGGTPIILQTRDLDGDGPDAPVVTVSDNLTTGQSYSGTITFLNETEDPAENITLEVEEESNEHQIFYTVGTGLDVTLVATNNDDNGNPLGTQFDLEAGAVSSGLLTFTLRHEPMKPNSGLGDAGGETDIEATFTVEVE
ncbi:type 1 periplasmic binding fold superfamily protein [Flavobacteriaceae bacterium TK19130]|nr:type 1 periplasmic binding fold superfamily protein [Thermobacterium salinum]